MAATLAAFLAARLAVSAWIRPHLQAVHESRIPIAADQVYNVMRGDWILDRDVYDSAGKLVVSNGDVTCGPPPEICHPDCGARAYNLLVYQPADRFWLFQYLETGLYLALVRWLRIWSPSMLQVNVPWGQPRLLRSIIVMSFGSRAWAWATRRFQARIRSG